jgi:hypothetical protein
MGLQEGESSNHNGVEQQGVNGNGNGTYVSVEFEVFGHVQGNLIHLYSFNYSTLK